MSLGKVNVLDDFLMVRENSIYMIIPYTFNSLFALVEVVICTTIK